MRSSLQYNIYKVSSLEEATKILNNLVDEQKKFKTIILYWTDNELSPDIRLELKDKDYNNFLLFRTSLKKSEKVSYERVWPATPWRFKSSPTFILPQFKPLSPATDKPQIGFCGVTKARTRNPFNVPHDVRGRLLRELQENDDITTQFIHRQKFYGGAMRKNHRRWRSQFVRNIENNIFNFCYRGTGNWSMRFYEVLCAGRIPVLIKSDTELPFENEIDWSNKIILADNTKDAAAKMIDVFNNRDLLKMQRECQELYNEYLSQEGFMKNIHKMF